MPGSLFDTSAKLRRGVVIVLVIVGLVILVDTVIKFFNSPNNPFLTSSTPYLEPNNAFGTIPVPAIPGKGITDDSLPTFAFDGVFGKFPDAAFVYRMEEPREKLDTIESAGRTARNIGFTGDFAEVGDGVLEWQNEAQSRRLSFDRNLGVWRMRTQYFLDAEAARPKRIQENISEYEGKGKSVASSLGFTSQSLSQGKAVAKLAKLGINGLFTSPLNSSSADYVTVDIYRQFDMAKLKSNLSQAQKADLQDLRGIVYKDDPRIGSFHAVLTGQVNDITKDVYEFDFVNYEYINNPAIYPIISPQEAWDRVRSNKGALVLLQSANADYFGQSEVLNVSRFVAAAATTELGYWEPPIENQNRFTYPIYIFRGRVEFSDNRPVGSFVFYVDALRR